MRVRHAERLRWLGKLIKHALVDVGEEEPWLAREIGIATRTLNDRINAVSDWKYEELVVLADVLWKGDMAAMLSAAQAPPQEARLFTKSHRR